MLVLPVFLKNNNEAVGPLVEHMSLLLSKSCQKVRSEYFQLGCVSRILRQIPCSLGFGVLIEWGMAANK
jgi:hypothetical protein